jgi:hypothetical protein
MFESKCSFFAVDVHFWSNCHKDGMSQWTKHPVDIPFGSICSVDVPLVDVLSMHPDICIIKTC